MRFLLVISCSGWLKTEDDGGPLPSLSQSPVLLISSLSKLAPDHTNELKYSAVPLCGSVYCAAQGDLNYWPVDEILKCDHSNESY